MSTRISDNTIKRVCKVFGYMNILFKKGVEHISSVDIGKYIGARPETVRKDLSLMGITGFTRAGYKVSSLKQELAKKLKLDKTRKACIVGLGRLGSALLDYEKFIEDGFEIIAGFDQSINKLERLRTNIEVFPSREIVSVVKKREIEIGIIAVPAESAQQVADDLASAGIKGILNFSPAEIGVPRNIVCLSMDFTNALRFLSVKTK